MTADEALACIREHGVVLMSAKGPVPRMTELIAGAPVKGSWWAHPQGHHMFSIFQHIGDSPEVLVCRLVGGKISFVHRRLWPALARLAKHFEPDRISQVQQEHTKAGHHVNRERPFPEWVPAEVLEQAQQLSEAEARLALGSWVGELKSRGAG
jgi:hypothetical protein